MAKKTKLLSDLFHDTLKDVYFAENKILKTLPKMAKAAQSKDLKAAFVKHEKETHGQVKRLQQIFGILGKPSRAKTYDAILGITDEGAEIMKDYKGMPASMPAFSQRLRPSSITNVSLRYAARLGGRTRHAGRGGAAGSNAKGRKGHRAALTTLAKSVVNVEAEAVLKMTSTSAVALLRGALACPAIMIGEKAADMIKAMRAG